MIVLMSESLICRLAPDFKRGFFTRHDLVFEAQNDHYACPAGQKGDLLALGAATRGADQLLDAESRPAGSEYIRSPEKIGVSAAAMQGVQQARLADE